MSSHTTLHRIADRLAHQPAPKKDVTAWVRSAKADGLLPRSITLPAATAEVVALAEAQRDKRAARQAARITSCPATLTARLAAHKQARRNKVCEAVRAARKGLYRVATAVGRHAPKSGHTTRVQIGTPGVKSDSCRVWGDKWAATASEHTYTVAAGWIETVQDRDLAVCDGMLTLSAEPVLGHGPELFRALWVEQGRGCSLNQVRGYIARIDGTTYHAATAKAALDGVQRKAGLKPARRRGTLDLDRLVRRHGDLPVTFADRDGIACVSGSRSWCEAVGIDPDGQATVAELVAGYRLRPMPEVLQVVRRVVRSGRRPADARLPESSLELPTGRIVFDAEGGFRILPDTDPSAN